ncbi:MAG: sulfite exporter TauE/SafE family protein, partial [Bacteroidetes bacterium]|nr:sulfite exporter TauE/SafE family protein [Bacteroidota bacterium]
GSRVLTKAEAQWLRIVFAIVITILAVEMIYNGAKHRF